MVHLDEVGEFVLHDVVLLVSRQQNQVEREVDASLCAAASPASFGRGNPDVRDDETPLSRHVEETRHE